MQIKAEIRNKFGKANNVLRAAVYVPAELYGHGVENVHLSVPLKDFAKLFEQAGENTVIEILVGKDRYPAVINEVKKNYRSDETEHVDFYQVRMDEVVKVSVPIELIGESPAVKEMGGVVNRSMEDVEVESLPGNLPVKFVLDIGGLTELNQSLYVKDLEIPEGVKIMIDPDAVILTITPPAKEEEIKPVEPVDLSAVKVESEEKKAERDKDKDKDKEAQTK